MSDYELPQDLKDSERELYEMFVECTGRVLVDSGFENGRAWQRNRLRDIRKDPPATYDLFIDGRRFEYVSVSTYHFLQDRLTFDEKATDIFKKWSRRKSVAEDGLWQQMVGFPKWLARMLSKADVRGPFGGERGGHCYVYTYNEDNVLNQNFQVCAFEVNDTEYYVVSLHNGADARWGFTDAKVFTGNGCSEWAVFDYARATLSCGDHHWDTENGCSYRSDEAEPRDFDEIRLVLTKDHPEYDKAKDTFKRGEPVVRVDKNGRMHCPVIGCRKLLQPWPWP